METPYERDLRLERERSECMQRHAEEAQAIMKQINADMMRAFPVLKLTDSTVDILRDWLVAWLRERFPDSDRLGQWRPTIKLGSARVCMELEDVALMLLRERDQTPFTR